MLLFQEESYKIRGACFKVWNEFGGAFKESVVQKALVLELKKQQLNIEQQKKIKIYYDGQFVGMYVPDIIIENKIVIELKSKEFITKQDEKQFWQYLKATDYKLGFLINFGSERLIIKRVVYDIARSKIS